MGDAELPTDASHHVESLSALDWAIWSEKMKGASNLEISLKLLLSEDVIRRHLQTISRSQDEMAVIKKHTEAVCEEMSAVWNRWLDEQMPESMKTTLLLAVVMNVAVRSLTPLVAAVAVTGSRGGFGPARNVGQALIDSICDGLRRRVDEMIVDEGKEQARKN